MDAGGRAEGPHPEGGDLGAAGQVAVRAHHLPIRMDGKHAEDHLVADALKVPGVLQQKICSLNIFPFFWGFQTS